MINTKRINFLNTYVDNLTFEEAKSAVDELIQSKGHHYVVTPNSDIIVKMQYDEELKHICDHANLILVDGQILVKLSKLTKNPIVERVCMTDFVWNVFDLAMEKNYSIFLFGGKYDILKSAEKKIKERCKSLNIVGSYSPKFGFENDLYEIEKCNKVIREAKADILLVFLGCPKQEKFIYNNKDKYKVKMSIPMGGCVDFLAGKVKRAPKWMQDVGLEWFFRFLQEPKRMFKRYFIDDIKIFSLFYKYRNNLHFRNK